MTLGEDRVRVNFNVSNSTDVDVLKSETARLIDLCEAKRREVSKLTLRQTDEVQRLWSLAQTYYEVAAMFAVKAATA